MRSVELDQIIQDYWVHNKMKERISVVGLGKLGLCLAAVLAHRGFDVVGIDIDSEKVKAIKLGRSPIYEPGLEQLIQKNRDRLRATTHYLHISKTSVTFVVLPTPSEPSGAFSLRYVEPAVKEIGRQIAKKKSYHLVVITSTVGLGAMDNVIKPTLESAANKKCGEKLGLCYNPEFIALGNVIKGLLQPDFVLIGESDEKAGRTLASILKKVCINNPPIERMEFANAELAKIAVNAFVTMKISFANTLAEICEKIKDGNIDKVTKAIGRDRRIGEAYLKGGLGYGGPCFPRDNIAFEFYARQLGAQAELARATHLVNIYQPKRIMSLLIEAGLKPASKVGILGLSYKPNTKVVEESQALYLIHSLLEFGCSVNVFDPVSMDEVRNSLGEKVRYCTSASECVKESDFIILTTPWLEFRNIPIEHFQGKCILDCWRFLPSKIRKVARYVAVGVSSKF